MKHQWRSFIFFTCRSLSLFLLCGVVLSISLVGTAGAMEGIDQIFYQNITFQNNREISVLQSQNMEAQGYLSVLPLSFIPNTGQIDPQVRFMVTGRESTLYFTRNEVMIAARENIGSQPVTHIIRQTFLDANANPVIEAEDLLHGSANFFSGSDPSKWRTNVPTYGSVIYHDLYPGIDLRYKGTDGTLKREFVVAPGTNPSAIRLRYEGIDSLTVDDIGSLIITTGNRYPHGITNSLLPGYSWFTNHRPCQLPGYGRNGYRLFP